jgi:hypothetical protein
MDQPMPEDLSAELNRELEALKAAEGIEGVSEDLLRFNAAVAQAQVVARAGIRALGGLPEGKYDSGVLLNMVRALDEAAGKSAESTGMAVLAIEAARKPDLLARIAEAAQPGGDARVLGEVARDVGLPADAVLLVGRMLAAPFAWEVRLHAGKSALLDVRDSDDRRAGRCPTCGSLPSLAVLDREDGSRRLLCSFCGEVWLAPRLMCPACGNRDHDKLGTLGLGETDSCWAEVCDVCRRYIKTVDERRLPQGYVVALRAEDARSLHLDLIAEQDGYMRATS